MIMPSWCHVQYGKQAERSCHQAGRLVPYATCRIAVLMQASCDGDSKHVAVFAHLGKEDWACVYLCVAARLGGAAGSVWVTDSLTIIRAGDPNMVLTMMTAGMPGWATVLAVLANVGCRAQLLAGSKHSLRSLSSVGSR